MIDEVREDHHTYMYVLQKQVSRDRCIFVCTNKPGRAKDIQSKGPILFFLMFIYDAMTSRGEPASLRYMRVYNTECDAVFINNGNVSFCVS